MILETGGKVVKGENDRYFSKYLSDMLERINEKIAEMQSSANTITYQMSADKETVSGYKTDTAEYKESAEEYMQSAQGYAQSASQTLVTITGYVSSILNYLSAAQGYSQSASQSASSAGNIQVQIAEAKAAIDVINSSLHTLSDTVNGYKTTTKGYKESAEGTYSSIASIKSAIDTIYASVQTAESNVSSNKDITEGYKEDVEGLKEECEGKRNECAAFANFVFSEKIIPEESTITLLNNKSYRIPENVNSFTLQLPDEVSEGYMSSLVFKSGTVATSITYSAVNPKWHGDDIIDNVFVPNSNRVYHIIFENDGFNIVAFVAGYKIPSGVIDDPDFEF